MRGSALGLLIEATGGNARASELAGVGTRAMILAVYVWCGLCAALAGVIAAADIMGADANNAGLWLELDAILAVVIGGTSLFGGRFSLVLAVLGALIIQAMNTGILLSRLSAGVQSCWSRRWWCSRCCCCNRRNFPALPGSRARLRRAEA